MPSSQDGALPRAVLAEAIQVVGEGASFIEREDTQFPGA
jgi:hypothetical protein